MKPLTIFLFVLAALMMIIPIFIMVYGYEKVETEVLCVDGQGNTNLDGKMCKSEFQSIYGLNKQDSFHLNIMCFFLIVIGLLLLSFTIGGRE